MYIVYLSVCMCVYMYRYDQSSEVVLREWILQKMAMKKRVSRQDLRQKALELITPHNPDFQASSGWITSFLCHHEINLKTMAHGTGCIKSKNAKSKAAYNHHFITGSKQQQSDHLNNQDAPTKTSIIISAHHLQKIRKPRQFLKQKINWKVFVSFACIAAKWLIFYSSKWC